MKLTWTKSHSSFFAWTTQSGDTILTPARYSRKPLGSMGLDLPQSKLSWVSAPLLKDRARAHDQNQPHSRWLTFNLGSPDAYVYTKPVARGILGFHKSLGSNSFPSSTRPIPYCPNKTLLVCLLICFVAITTILLATPSRILPHTAHSRVPGRECSGCWDLRALRTPLEYGLATGLKLLSGSL